MFNIIKTNRNKTAIAPTYTTRNVIGKNSKFNKNNKDETLQKVKIRNKTEKTGFLEAITKIADSRAKLENRQKNAKNRVILKIYAFRGACLTP
jgi:hypothetical protein